MWRDHDAGFRIVRTYVPPVAQARKFTPPFRITVQLRDGDTYDAFRNETYDTIESAKQRLAGAKFFGTTSNIRIIDANGNQVD
jgi:hypothetical protein